MRNDSVYTLSGKRWKEEEESKDGRTPWMQPERKKKRNMKGGVEKQPQFMGSYVGTWTEKLLKRGMVLLRTAVVRFSYVGTWTETAQTWMVLLRTDVNSG